MGYEAWGIKQKKCFIQPPDDILCFTPPSLAAETAGPVMAISHPHFLVGKNHGFTPRIPILYLTKYQFVQNRVFIYRNPILHLIKKSVCS